MSANPSLDPELFQKLLANAFTVQESGLDTQVLSAVLELQRLIATGESDVDRTMYQVADCARNVAGAAGIAIALLRGDQLVYQAGNGCAATYVGRHLTAILSSSPHNGPRSEILRVENAETDMRIEGAICRQFEAQSLLIMPIYHLHALAGVLQVLFNEAHGFEHREIRAYRLMASLIEESISRYTQLDQKKTSATQPATVQHAIAQNTVQIKGTSNDDEAAPGLARMRGIGQAYEAAPVVTAPWHRLRWSVGVTTVVTALVIAACWIAYDYRPASPVGSSLLPGSNAARQQIPFVPSKPTPAHSKSEAQAAKGGTGKMRAPSSVFKRVRVGPNEVDDIAEDVTIRHFMPDPAPPRLRRGYKDVYVGEDVTVRYFADKPAVASQTPPKASGPRQQQRDRAE